MPKVKNVIVPAQISIFSLSPHNGIQSIRIVCARGIAIADMNHQPVWNTTDWQQVVLNEAGVYADFIRAGGADDSDFTGTDFDFIVSTIRTFNGEGIAFTNLVEVDGLDTFAILIDVRDFCITLMCVN